MKRSQERNFQSLRVINKEVSDPPAKWKYIKSHPLGGFSLEPSTSRNEGILRPLISPKEIAG